MVLLLFLDFKLVAYPRSFVTISRTVDPETGDHILDAVAADGTAWWRVIALEIEEDTGWQLMQSLPLPD